MMDGRITGETDDLFGLSVIDNNDIEHVIDIRKTDGKITAHNQDGYPDDPYEREPDNHEHVRQARAYARHYVWQETDYEPFPVEKNLPGIKRVRQAIQDLPDDRFRDLFEDAYTQVSSHGFNEASLPAELPDAIEGDDWRLYMVDVYLTDGEVETVSDIHIRYRDENGDVTTQWNDDPFPERKPDARLQLVPDLVMSVEDFREYLDYHLRCQVRDCYIGAGVEPPEEYKVLGVGINELTGRYNLEEITLYEPYHEHHARIPGYTLEYDYGLGEYGKSITKLQRLTAADDELDEALTEFAESAEGKEKLQELLEDRDEDTKKTVMELINNSG